MNIPKKGTAGMLSAFMTCGDRSAPPVHRVRKLRCDDVRIEAEPLMQHGACRRTEAVAGDLVLRETHRAQCGIDRVLAHRPVVMALAADDHRTLAGYRVQFTQYCDRLLRQRNEMRRAVQFRAQLALHAHGWHGPHRCVEVDLGPLREAQLARAQQQHRRQLERGAHHGRGGVVVAGAQQLAEALRVDDRGEVLGVGTPQRILQLARWVSGCLACCDRVAEDLAGILQRAVCCLHYAACLDAPHH